MAFKRTLSLLRPTCRALITPQALVLAAGQSAQPVLQLRSPPSGRPQDQFTVAVSELLQLMDQSGCRGRRLHLVVSDFWARPLVLSMPGQNASDAEIDVVLQSHYRQTYGELMDGWCWCWERQADRLLAVAWPAGGLAALRRGVRASGGALASARPMAVEVASYAAPDAAAAWLAIIDRHALTLIRQQGGVWQRWCVLPGDFDMAKSLPLQLTRDVARQSDPCRTLIMIDLSASQQLPAVRRTLTQDGWEVKTIDPNPSQSSLAACLPKLASMAATA